MYKSVARQLLFSLSEGDHEEAHRLFKKIAKRVQNITPLLGLLSLMYRRNSPRFLCGIEFPNPVGLAAGLDKDAEVPLFVQALGFGFMEIGGILPRPQAGNETPRVFRLPNEEALINRMGFNSAGAEAVLHNFAAVEKRIKIPVGVSLGKMRDSPLESTADEYKKVSLAFRGHGDYLVVNVSSPNTRNLRNLQRREHLAHLVRDVVYAEYSAIALGQRKVRPVFVKVSPDLSSAEIEEVYGACTEWGARGLIIGNTTVSRPVNERFSPVATKEGGLSGKPLFDLMRKAVREVRKLDSNFPVIACGGINSAERGKIMLEEEGANLIQILTGLIYEGPRLVRELARL